MTTFQVTYGQFLNGDMNFPYRKFSVQAKTQKAAITSAKKELGIKGRHKVTLDSGEVTTVMFSHTLGLVLE